MLVYIVITNHARYYRRPLCCRRLPLITVLVIDPVRHMGIKVIAICGGNVWIACLIGLPSSKTCMWWPGDLCCEARHPRQTHFQRVAPSVQAVHTDETKLLTHVCQAADCQRLCSDAHNVFLARADVRSRCGLRNCLGYM